jgi:hypothetical protein
MIISKNDFLLKVVVESIFSFVKYFFKTGFWTQWTTDMDNNKIQTTHLHKQQKTTNTQQKFKIHKITKVDL